MDAPTLDAAADELYSLAPERFVARRGELARQARAAGDRPLAQQIGALRRPTVAAWLLNLGVRNSLTSLVALLHLAREVREAEADRDGARVRDLGSRRAELERRVLSDLPAFGTELGIAVRPGVLDEVRATLRAVLADPALAERLAAGRLERAGDHGDLDLMAALGAMTADLAPARPVVGSVSMAGAGEHARADSTTPAVGGPDEPGAVVPTDMAEQDRLRQEREQEQELERRRQEREQERRALRQQAEDARREERRTQDELDAASRELTAVQQQVTAASERVADLERQLVDAREAMRGHEGDADRARQALSVAVLAHEAARAARASAEARLG